MADGGGERPLRKIAVAFKDLASTVHSQSNDVDVVPFCEACSFVFPLIGCLGPALKFAESDFVANVNDLSAASETISTLPSILDEDVKSGTVRKAAGSHSRSLLRVRRGLHLVKVVFEQIILTEGNSFRDPAIKAYSQALAPYHGWAIRKAVGAGLRVLSTKAQLLRKLNEDVLEEDICIEVPTLQTGERWSKFSTPSVFDYATSIVLFQTKDKENSARIYMQEYISTSAPVIAYIDELFLSRDLGIDW